MSLVDPPPPQMLDVTGAASSLSAVQLRQRARRVAPYATEALPGFEAPVVADFYGGETRHGRELRLHSGGMAMGWLWWQGTGGGVEGDWVVLIEFSWLEIDSW